MQRSSAICLAPQYLIELVTHMARAINQLSLAEVAPPKGRNRAIAYLYEINGFNRPKSAPCRRQVLAELSI
jgi:hypothetical protein